MRDATCRICGLPIMFVPTVGWMHNTGHDSTHEPEKS